MIEELKKRGFKTKGTIYGLSTMCKDYEGAHYHYQIIVTEEGNVYLVNYDKIHSGTFCLNFDNDFDEDLIFIVQHLEFNK